MTSDNSVRWTAQNFELDARGSNDPDGNVTAWHFDFGDGQTKDVSTQDGARVVHAFTHGGKFTVTLLVTDDGRQQEGRLTGTTSKVLAVNQGFAFSGQVLNTTVTNVGYAPSFTTYGGVGRYEMSANLTSTLPAGSSDVQVRILDATGAVVGEKTVTVNAGQTLPMNVTGGLTTPGETIVAFSVKTGGAQISGGLRVFYDG